jgi:hypothetical protein
LVTACKHVNDIRAVARQLPITKRERVLEAVFSIGSVLRLCNEDRRLAEGNCGSSVLSCESGCVEKTRKLVRNGRQPENCVAGYSLDKKEAEDFSLLETVARERLVKTQQAGKGLVFAAVICKVSRLAAAL